MNFGRILREAEFMTMGRRGGFFGDKRGHFGGPLGGGRGRGMRAAKMLAAGDLQMVILLLLEEKARHGYEIIKALEDHSSGVYSPSPGMVYPALTYLEELGFALAEADGNKKLFRITPSGVESLAKKRAEAVATLEQLALYGQKMAQFQNQYERAENENDPEGGDSFWGGAADARHATKMHWIKAKMELRAIRDELKAVLHEKIAASPEEHQRVFDVLRRAIAEIKKGS